MTIVKGREAKRSEGWKPTFNLSQPKKKSPGIPLDREEEKKPKTSLRRSKPSGGEVYRYRRHFSDRSFS